MAVYRPGRPRLGDTAMKHHGWELVMDRRLSGSERIKNIMSWIASNPDRELFPTYFGYGVTGRHHLTDALCAAPLEGAITRVSNKFTHPVDRQVGSELPHGALVARREALVSELMSGQVRLAAAEKVIEGEA